MFFNSASRSPLGLMAQVFFFALLGLVISPLFSSCSKDKVSGLAADLEGEYSAYMLPSTTGNIDLRVTSINSDEVEVEFLTDYHFLYGYQLLTTKYRFKLTHGAGSIISLNSSQSIIELFHPPTNQSVNFDAVGSGAYTPNSNGQSEGSLLQINFTGQINGQEVIGTAGYIKQ